ncbi:mucin-19-like [Discoglossus pictus]
MQQAQKQPPESAPTEEKYHGECGTWGKGSYKTLNGEIMTCHSQSTVCLCRHCSETASEFNVEVKYGANYKIEMIKIQLDSIEIAVSTKSIAVNGEVVEVPYMNKMTRIRRCGMYTAVNSRRGILDVLINRDSVTVRLNKKYETCGICGDGHSIPSKGTDAHEYIKSHIIGNIGQTVAFTGTPSDESLTYFRSLSDIKFVNTMSQELQSKYSHICGHAYDSCKEKDKRLCVCPTLCELARHTASKGCSQGLRDWRRHPNVVCDVPECPATQLFDECALVNQPTCTNQNPSQEGFIAGCTCPEGLVLDDISGSNECVKIADCPCSFAKHTYKSGDKRKSICESECTCSNGKWICTEQKCPGRCSVEHGIYITTFDGKPYKLHGDCSYFLTFEWEWQITAKLTHTESTTYMESITISVSKDYKQYKFDFTKDGLSSNIDLEGQNNFQSDAITIYYIDEYYQVKLHNGLLCMVQTGPLFQVYISVPQTGFEKTAGLCGSYNHNAEDDFRSAQNIVETLPEAFAQSWKTSSCPDPHYPSCINLDNEQFADEHCAAISSSEGAFAKCHNVVDYREFLERCKFITCTSNNPVTSCCVALSNYATACAENGVKVEWRNDMCKKSCPNNLVLQYTHASCHPTCQSLSQPDSGCGGDSLQVEVCGCPEGQYINSEDTCVPKDQCECHLDSHIIPAHTSISVNNYMCHCSGGIAVCEKDGDSSEVCTGGSEFVDCNYGENSRRVDLECNTRHLPRMQQGEVCKPGCYCPPSMVRNSKGECVLPSECPCLFGGEEYENGKSVTISCNKCTCKEGLWECTDNKCQSICHIHGDGHIWTFDGKSFDFDGLCQYTLVQDACNGQEGTFSVSEQSEPCCEDGLTCSRKIVISISGTVLVLQDGKVRIEKTDCSSGEIIYSVNSVGMYITVSFVNGFQIIWDRNTRCTVELDPMWKGRVCGLCGNNNGNIMDEFIGRDGSYVSEAMPFGNSWKTDPTCQDTVKQMFPCDANPYCKTWALRKCQLLREDTFSACHRKVDPAPYYEACMREACACDMEGKYLGFCTAVAMYAEKCISEGICIDWRTNDRCPVYCDYFNKRGENIWHYEPCGSAQMQTCNGNSHAMRLSPLLEGCYARCPKHAPYLDENTRKCVKRSHCSCLHDGRIIAAGRTMQDECGNIWQCLHGVVVKVETSQPGYPVETSQPGYPVETSQPGYPGETSPPEQPGETSPPEQPVETSPPEQPGETSPPEQPGETSPPEQPVETSPPEQPVETSPPEQPGETSPPEQPGETSPPEQPGKFSLLYEI